MSASDDSDRIDAAFAQADAVPDGPPPPRPGFRTWRRSRPFWGGLLAVIGGVELILIPLAPMPVVIHQGIAGISSYLIGAVLALAGVLLWFQPAQRTFYGVVAVVLSLASFVTSNFGGFAVGMLLGLVGGALGFAWTPGTPGKPDKKSRAARRGGTGVLGLAMLPALAALPAAPAHGTASAQACLIPIFCPASPSPSPSPARTSPVPATPPTTGVPTPSPTQQPGEHGTDGGHQGKDGSDAKAKGKAARFVPKRKHLRAQPAGHGQGTVAVQSNTLTAASMTQYGLSFDGVVAMPTAHGTIRMLKFSADRVVMDDSDLVAGAASRRTSTADTSLELNGHVRLYTTRLHAKLFGLPLTFTPDFPPPLVLRTMRMTDVTSDHNVTVADRADIHDLRLRVGT
ncbi:MAG TPA: DUF6114 domain-containing protein [Streptosporangiaceae bacterium]|jgi:hypothetical protein